MSDDLTKRLTNRFGEVESSGGKRREHPYQTSGSQAGTRAVSTYGMMPRTAYEFVKKNTAFASTPLGQEILATNGDPEAINQITADPEKDQQLMEAYTSSSLEKLQQLGVPEAQVVPAVAFAHRRGEPGMKRAIAKEKNFESDPYVKEFVKGYAPAPGEFESDTLDMPPKLYSGDLTEDDLKLKMKLDILRNISEK